MSNSVYIYWVFFVLFKNSSVVNWTPTSSSSASSASYNVWFSAGSLSSSSNQSNYAFSLYWEYPSSVIAKNTFMITLVPIHIQNIQSIITINLWIPKFCRLWPTFYKSSPFIIAHNIVKETVRFLNLQLVPKILTNKMANPIRRTTPAIRELRIYCPAVYNVFGNK